ncbi:MAG: ADP-ribosyl-(dinitrogen reductase) glycohydrolase [bacterium ADurb.Bin236]|nr:MAG: ADP-ribosyl-(dinitrogen reductase) glycohydrolase [bacterium ADurb.Bin236]
MAADIIDAKTGTVMGLAAGDALGAPVEGAKPGAIKSAFRRVCDFVDPADMLAGEKIYKWRKPGLYTDETQQALALLDSLLLDKGLNPEKAAARLADLSRGAEFRHGVYRGASGALMKSATSLRQGAVWSLSGLDTDSNGAAARVAPVAVYFHANPGAVADNAAKSALFTHRNFVGVAAAAAVARAVYLLLDMDELEPRDRPAFVSQLAAICAEDEEMIADRYGAHLFDFDAEARTFISSTLCGLAERVDGPPAETADWIASNASRRSRVSISRPSAPAAAASVVFSVFLAVRHSASFEDALVEAVNAGGDSDAVGAMTGAMSGALHGFSSIPERWLKGLANRKQLTARAQALASGKWMKSKLEDLYELEYGLTRREHEERLARMRKAGVEFPDNKSAPAAFSEPTPADEKFDRKKFRREQSRLKRWAAFSPADE